MVRVTSVKRRNIEKELQFPLLWCFTTIFFHICSVIKTAHTSPKQCQGSKLKWTSDQRIWGLYQETRIKEFIPGALWLDTKASSVYSLPSLRNKENKKGVFSMLSLAVDTPRLDNKWSCLSGTLVSCLLSADTQIRHQYSG